MKPREIPFERCVLPIVNEPTVMRWRLELADWLARNGHKERAHWFRRICAHCDQQRPLSESFPPHGIHFPDDVLAPEDPNISVAHYLRSRWLEFRPDYWQELERIQKSLGVLTVWHFGRAAILAGAYPANHYPNLGDTPGYISAFREGWLEAICCSLYDANQVKSLLAWPKSHRALPLHIDTLRCQTVGFTDDLMQGLLLLQGLHGIMCAPGELAYPCMKRFGELAQNLRYLSLLNLKKTGPSYRILEQLRDLSELRVLSVGCNLPTDEQIKELAAIPKLQCLHLAGQNVTDKGLLAVAEIRTLRTLTVNSRRVTAAGIYALRETRPDLRVVAIDDTLELLGPV